MPQAIQFDRTVCAALNSSLKLEWLETNGLGGFASATLCGAHTRRYHGLLTAALAPPGGRYLLLSRFEEALLVGGVRYDLSTNLFPGTVHPEGFRYLKQFELDPFPVFTFEAGGVQIEKRVFLVHGENTLVVEYEVLDQAGGAHCTLELRPLVAFREIHSLTRANSELDRHFQEEPGVVSMQPYRALPRLYLAHNAARIEAVGDWYFNFDYPVERERGLECDEDLFCPLAAVYELSAGRTAECVASTIEYSAEDAGALRERELARRRPLVARSPSPSRFGIALTRAADSFVVERGRRHTIIAGYPWFGAWSRDTLISLPGLTLATDRPEIARSILLDCAENVDQGMLPNCLPEAGVQPDYNTADATLWFFEAARRYAAATGDLVFIHERIYACLRNIIDWHLNGTRFGIRADSDGLLLAGEEGTQLTWMDAKVGGWVVTPRAGKPVEIQTLWHNALKVTAEFARQFDDGEGEALLSHLAAHAAKSFVREFWNESAGCLYDVVDGSERDGAIRPNQIFAISLPHSMVPRDLALRILEVVERELLTPYGLRTLDRHHPDYRGRYQGSPRERDAAYHQGTVWPWLLGPFITAYVRAHGRSAESRQRARGWLRPFEEHLRVAGLGSISEVFDGDPPHTPRGAIAQAWSVAELLRVLVEDIEE